MLRPLAPVRYPNAYSWFVFLSAMDLMMTWIILHFGGREVNGVAKAILDRHGLVGMVIFKFALVTFVVCLCEWIGRHNDRLGRRVAFFAVAATCFPVVLAAALLISHQA